jgi:hypothetical protein
VVRADKPSAVANPIPLDARDAFLMTLSSLQEADLTNAPRLGGPISPDPPASRRVDWRYGDASRRPRYQIERKVVLRCFNVDEFCVARAKTAQFMAYGFGIAFIVKQFLPLVIGRPSTVVAHVPAGDPRIGSGSKCNAIGHRADPFPLKLLSLSRKR